MLCFGGTILAISGAISRKWLFLTLPGSMLGIFALGFGWLMRSSYWLHVRIKNEDINLRLAIPLPLMLLNWALRIARLFVPELAGLDPDELVAILAETSPDDAFSVDVQEAGGEHIQVSYG